MNWSKFESRSDLKFIIFTTVYASITLLPTIKTVYYSIIYPSWSGGMGKFSTVCSSCSSLNCFRLFATPWTVDQASRSFSVSWSLLRFMCIVSVMPSSHPILCHPLLLLPSVFSSIRVFSNELAFRIRWPEYWSLSPSPSSEYSGLISFRVDWFDLLAVQGTLKSLLQHHSSKAMFISVLFTLEVLFWMSD